MLLLCTFTLTPSMEAPSLARSLKLQEHVWERGGTLAPGTSQASGLGYLPQGPEA